MPYGQKKYMHRILSIDIISLWEIAAIARMAFISIEKVATIMQLPKGHSYQ
jgi:hypothetical protein